MSSKYENLEVVGQVVAIDSMLTDKFQPLNKERFRNYNMLISKLQWDAKAKEKLESEGRPANAYNLLLPVINAISGYEKGGRKRIALVPRSERDSQYLSVMSPVLDFCLDKSNFDYHRSKAFLDAVIARIGWMVTDWSYENDPLGMLVTKRYNPFRLAFDVTVNDLANFHNECKYIRDAGMYSLEEILTTFALDDNEMFDEILEKADSYQTKAQATSKKHAVASWIDRLVSAASSFFSYSSRDSLNSSILQNSTDWFDASTARYKIVELHERRLIKKLYYNDYEIGGKIDLTPKFQTNDARGYDHNALIQYLEENSLKKEAVTRALVKEIWRTAVIPSFNMVVAEDAYPVQNNQYMYTPVFAYDYHPDVQSCQSVIDDLIDPQNDYNQRRSTMLEMIKRLMLAGYIAEEDAIGEYEDSWINRRIGQIRYVKKDALNKIKPDQPFTIPPSLYNEAQESKLLINEISGVTKTTKGQQEASNETGKLFLAKKEQSETMLLPLFDNLDLSMQFVGKNAIDYIQHYMKEERMIRIVDDGKPSEILINQRTVFGIKNDVSIGEYDIEISQQPYGKTARQESYLELVDLINFISEKYPQTVPFLIPILIKASDNPYKDKLLTVVEQISGYSVDQLNQQVQDKQLADLMMQIEAKQKILQTDKMAIDNESARLGLQAEFDGMDLGKYLNEILSENKTTGISK